MDEGNLKLMVGTVQANSKKNGLGSVGEWKIQSKVFHHTERVQYVYSGLMESARFFSSGIYKKVTGPRFLRFYLAKMHRCEVNFPFNRPEKQLCHISSYEGLF